MRAIRGPARAGFHGLVGCPRIGRMHRKGPSVWVFLLSPLNSWNACDSWARPGRFSWARRLPTNWTNAHEGAFCLGLPLISSEFVELVRFVGPPGQVFMGSSVAHELHECTG